MIKITDKDGNKLPTPWLTYWQRIEVVGDPRERMNATAVSNMRMWRMFNWSNQAAESVLKWIATGSFDLAAGVKVTR